MATRSKLNWKLLKVLVPILEKEGWSHAQIAVDWGVSLATLEGHLTREVGMPTPSKHDYPSLFAEYDRRLASGESPKEIRATFESRGIVWGTFQNRRTQAKKVHHSTPQEHQDTPEAHLSTPDEPGLWLVHSGTPEHTEISPDEQYTQVHSDTPPDPNHTEVHPGTLEAHQEVMEDVSQSVPDAPYIGIEGAYQGLPEHPSTPIVHPEVSLPHSTMVHSGAPARQEHLISTPIDR
jgi:hypothetical protein